MLTRQKILVIGLVLIFGGLLMAQLPQSQVLSVLIARDVVAREPVEPGAEFSSNAGSLACWSQIETSAVPVKIFHVWFYENKEMARVELIVRVAGVKWRTWSRKKTLPSQKGSWRVEIQDENNTILASADFVIK